MHKLLVAAVLLAFAVSAVFGTSTTDTSMAAMTTAQTAMTTSAAVSQYQPVALLSLLPAVLYSLYSFV